MQLPASIAGYKLIEQLGEGPFGLVFRAEDNRGLPFVIKTLKPAFWAQSDGYAAFDRLSTSLKVHTRLQHANLCRAFGVVKDESARFYGQVVEYLDGHLLSAVNIRQSDLVSVLNWFEQLSDVLEWLHSKGMVHANVKPTNVMLLSYSGHKELSVKLLDLSWSAIGVAAVEPGPEAYISPEQYVGTVPSAKSDQWAVATMLERLLSQMNLDVPASLRSVIGKGEAIDPDDRYARMKDFGLALSEVRRELSQGSRAVEHRDTEDPSAIPGFSNLFEEGSFDFSIASVVSTSPTREMLPLSEGEQPTREFENDDGLSETVEFQKQSPPYIPPVSEPSNKLNFDVNFDVEEDELPLASRAASLSPFDVASEFESTHVGLTEESAEPDSALGATARFEEDDLSVQLGLKPKNDLSASAGVQAPEALDDDLHLEETSVGLVHVKSNQEIKPAKRSQPVTEPVPLSWSQPPPEVEPIVEPAASVLVPHNRPSISEFGSQGTKASSTRVPVARTPSIRNASRLPMGSIPPDVSHARWGSGGKPAALPKVPWTYRIGPAFAALIVFCLGVGVGAYALNTAVRSTPDFSAALVDAQRQSTGEISVLGSRIDTEVLGSTRPGPFGLKGSALSEGGQITTSHVLESIAFAIPRQGGTNLDPLSENILDRLSALDGPVAAVARNCLRRRASSCLRLGQMRQMDGQQVEALVAFEKACALKEASGCFRAAGGWSRRPSGDHKALLLYERACKAKMAEGCHLAGVFIRAGRGVAADSDRALELEGQACKLGRVESCAAMASQRRLLK